MHVCARPCARGVCRFLGRGRDGFPPQGCSAGHSSSLGGSRGWVGAAGPPPRVSAGQSPVTTTSGHRWQGSEAPTKPPSPLPACLLGHAGSCPPSILLPYPWRPPSRGDVGSPGGSSTPRGCRAVESPCSWKLAAFPSARLPKHVGGEAGREEASLQLRGAEAELAQGRLQAPLFAWGLPDPGVWAFFFPPAGEGQV